MNHPEIHWSGRALDSFAPRIHPRLVDRRALAVTMPDGTRLAVELHLPRDRGHTAKLPTILHQTRYFRAIDVNRPWGVLPVAKLPDLYADTRRRFLARGYAWLDVDVRGSGASEGKRPTPWSPDEVRDGKALVDWIVAQSWSDGRVGSLGISYGGTCAEMLLVNNHPAVRAVAPCFSLHDVFADVAFPGGIHLAWFTARWGRFNALLDRNRFGTALGHAIWLIARSHRPSDASTTLTDTLVRRALDSVTEAQFVPWMARALDLLTPGVRRLDDDASRTNLARAIEQHAANFNVHEGALAIGARDDENVAPDHPDWTIDTFSPHTYAAQLRASGTPVQHLSGWRDAGYPRSAIHRFTSIGNAGSRMVLGPVGHGGNLFEAPWQRARASRFEQDLELLRFFDLHVRSIDDGIANEPRVHYFTSTRHGGAWHAANEWPPPGITHSRWELGDGSRLVTDGPARDGHDVFAMDRTVGTGESARWRCLLGGLVRGDYHDTPSLAARRVAYTSEPFARDTTVTGEGWLSLWLAVNGTDAGVFAYLEEVAPDGTSTYLTEGMVRASHRGTLALDASSAALTGERTHLRRDVRPLVPDEPVCVLIELLPFSHTVSRGNRVRLALAAGDADHFADVPGSGDTWRILRGPAHPSALVLPVEAVG